LRQPLHSDVDLVRHGRLQRARAQPCQRAQRRQELGWRAGLLCRRCLVALLQAMLRIPNGRRRWRGLCAMLQP
jgi:hypothetical protein